MKLSAEKVERTLGQFEAQVIPDGHPAVPELNRLFGDHTYFVDGHGLNIVEPTEEGAADAQIVKIASWSDESRTSLAPHEPEPTDTVVMLEPTH